MPWLAERHHSAYPVAPCRFGPPPTGSARSLSRPSPDWSPSGPAQVGPLGDRPRHCRRGRQFPHHPPDPVTSNLQAHPVTDTPTDQLGLTGILRAVINIGNQELAQGTADEPRRGGYRGRAPAFVEELKASDFHRDASRTVESRQRWGGPCPRVRIAMETLPAKGGARGRCSSRCTRVLVIQPLTTRCQTVNRPVARTHAGRGRRDLSQTCHARLVGVGSHRHLEAGPMPITRDVGIREHHN
jgi:hypothetical protein